MMFRPALRIATAPTVSRAVPRPHILRRFVSTAPPHKTSRSWKSSTARWGLAGALIYYYNTSTVFAEEPAYAVHAPPETSNENEEYATVASISEQRRATQSSPAPVAPPKEVATTTATVSDGEAVAPGSPEALEQEAGQEGAFNEETGEINWDCPCLGGMAHGPCGEQFRAAFSCFVFSQAEPKGVDCIEHFKTMQDCFREHPDVYGSELEDDEEPSERQEGGAVAIPPEADGAPAPQVASVGSSPPPQGVSDDASSEASIQSATHAGQSRQPDNNTQEDQDPA